jgi:excisionase family DNA binding protein
MTMMKVTEVAQRLNCSPSLVYALIESGRLKCHVIGNGRQGGKRVSEEQLAAFLMETIQSEEAPKELPASEKMRSKGFTVLDGDRLRESWEHRR